MNETYRLRGEVFAIPATKVAGGWVIYAPLQQVALLVNRSGLKLLAELDRGKAPSPDPREASILALLVDLGLVGEESRNEIPLSETVSYSFLPTGVTLFLTDACNLACRYCYADGGSRSSATMPAEVARAAVDLVVHNAQAQQEQAVVAFHGAGEPTVAWDLLRATVEYAEERAADTGVSLCTGLATNGLLTSQQVDWIAEHINSCMVSVDGIGSVHDYLRPRRGGGGSWETVEACLAHLKERGAEFGIRMTCTRDNISETPKAVATLCEQFQPLVVHLEPVYYCGRAIREDVKPPAADEFVETYRLSRRLALSLGAELFYSGARAWIPQLSFCQVSTPSFTVAPTGVVTACYEVSDPADVRAELFHYGRYVEAKGFCFDEEKITRLRRLTVLEEAKCQRCFCKYHCAGDCPAKRTLPGGQEMVRHRCAINRQLTLDLIEEVLVAADEGAYLRALDLTAAEGGGGHTDGQRATE